MSRQQARRGGDLSHPARRCTMTLPAGDPAHDVPEHPHRRARRWPAQGRAHHLQPPPAPKCLQRRPDARLGQALRQFDADEAIGCIVITGSEKAFAAGADIGGMAKYTYMDAYKGDFVTRNWETV